MIVSGTPKGCRSVSYGQGGREPAEGSGVESRAPGLG